MSHAGAPVGGTVRDGEHACCRFADPADRERLATAFIRVRVHRGDKVVYFSGDGDGNAVQARLERADAGLAQALTRRQLVVRDARDVYIPDGRFSADRTIAMLRADLAAARAAGYRGLSATGDVLSDICALPGGDQLGAYERGVAPLLESCAFLCHYDHAGFEPSTLQDVILAHEIDASPELAPIGRDGELAAAHDRRRGALRLSGELDFGCAQTVVEVLDTHFDDVLRLDLADLSFVDIAGMRALRFKRRRLELYRPSESVRRMLAVLGWDTDPDVVIVED
jgi:ABC-type transporter Mla MlaB component